MRNLFEKAKRYGWKVIAAVVALVTTYAPAVCAAESADEVAKQVTSPLNSLVDVLTSIMAAVGVLMLIKSVTERFLLAYSTPQRYHIFQDLQWLCHRTQN